MALGVYPIPPPDPETIAAIMSNEPGRQDDLSHGPNNINQPSPVHGTGIYF